MQVRSAKQLKRLAFVRIPVTYTTYGGKLTSDTGRLCELASDHAESQGLVQARTVVRGIWNTAPISLWVHFGYDTVMVLAAPEGTGIGRVALGASREQAERIFICRLITKRILSHVPVDAGQWLLRPLSHSDS
jgi:hypothetical protein